MAAMDFGGQMKSAWGCTETELDRVAVESENSLRTGLGMLVKMTRKVDLCSYVLSI